MFLSWLLRLDGPKQLNNSNIMTIAAVGMSLCWIPAVLTLADPEPGANSRQGTTTAVGLAQLSALSLSWTSCEWSSSSRCSDGRQSQSARNTAWAG